MWLMNFVGSYNFCSRRKTVYFVTLFHRVKFKNIKLIFESVNKLYPFVLYRLTKVAFQKLNQFNITNKKRKKFISLLKKYKHFDFLINRFARKEVMK